MGTENGAWGDREETRRRMVILATAGDIRIMVRTADGLWPAVDWLTPG